MRICVVGGGIIGLTTALRLKRELGSDVTLLTEKLSPDTTADGAAGIWSPYLIGDTPEEAQRRWAKETHDFIAELWRSEKGGEMGISVVSAVRLNGSGENERFPPFWSEIVYGFREMSPDEVSEIGRLTGKHRKGCEFVTFTIEPVKLLPHFIAELKRTGVEIIVGKKVTSLKEIDEHSYDILVNCTGLGARQLLGDEKVAPLRGQVMRVRAPWINKVILDDDDDGNYIICK